MKKSSTYNATRTIEQLSWEESANLVHIDYARRDMQRVTDNYYRGIGR